MATYNINLNLSTAAAQAQLSALQTAAGKPITAKVNFSQPLGRITGDLAMFDKSMAAASARVAAFGVTSGAIYLVSKAMSEAAKSMMLVDKELTELNTFLGQSQGQLKSFGDSLFSIAKNTATSFSAVAEAAKEFARQGLSMEDTLKRTNDALILSRISGLGAAESVTALTTAINSFNKSGLTSAEIVNKLVQVDSQFAVSSSDLAQALSRVGSSAQDSGVSIDQLVASVTAAQQTTGRGGAVIGNALKTIFTRMKRPEVIDQLREIGVAVKDQNGYFLDGISILKNYTDATKNLSQTEKAKTAELLGGIYQINVLNSLINDLSRSNGVYARALQASNSATDQAFDKNEALNQSLSATIEITKANLQQKGAAIATPLLTPLVKTGASIVNKTLNIFDKKEGDEEGAKSGRSFGESLLKGLGAAIAGPGLVIVGALAFAIGKKLLTFGTEAVRSLLGVTSASQNILNLQSLITSTLNNQPQIIQKIVSGQISQTTAAQALLTIMQQQAAQLQTNATLSSTLANTLAQGGFTVSPTTGLKKRRAMGYIPKADQDAERAGALSGGYSPGAVVKTPSSIGGIMNTSEKVKYVPGFSQPFINPPENSKAGRMHQENAIKQTGVNPYSSRGFIPNFAASPSSGAVNKAQQTHGNQDPIIHTYIPSLDGAMSSEKGVLKAVRQSGSGRKARDIRVSQERVALNAFQETLRGGGTDAIKSSMLTKVNFPGVDYVIRTEHGADKQPEIFLGQVKLKEGAYSQPDVVRKLDKGLIQLLAGGNSIATGSETKENQNKIEILKAEIAKKQKDIDGKVNNVKSALNVKYVISSNSQAVPVASSSAKLAKAKPITRKKYPGFIPNFAYLDEVEKLESEAGNGTAIFDTEPFPHVRNSSQPTFESAINDHGGLQNALSDSASMQKSAGLIKSKGFVPNFSKISDWWEQKRKDERLADMAAFRVKHGNMSNYQPQEGPSMMSGMIRSSLIGGASMMLSGAANENNVGTIANVQRGVPLAMAGMDIASGFARGRTGWGKAANVGMAIAQNAPAIISGFSGASQTEAGVRADQFQKVKDNTADKFNKLTQNAGQLAQSIEDLNNAYLDPSVSPETLIKLGKKQAELMRSMDKSNPQAAMKLATARTSAEKQTILTDAVESATKDKVVNDASIKFLELDDKKRKPKAIKSLFSDWSSQADMSKLDVKNLTPQNLGEALKKAGIGDVNKVLAGTKGKLITPFINFLQTNDKISDKEEITKNQLTNLRRPSSDIRMQNEQNKKLRAIKKSSRGDYLNDLVDYASNFGPESEIDARRNVDVAMESGQERARFGAMLSSKAEKMPGLSRFIGQGPSQELESSLKNSIKQTKDPKQKNELEAILSETKQSQNAMQVIESKADEKKKKDLALLALKQRLVFGGGMAASLSYEGKRASDEPTARASMQNALGNRFGSRNTADAGYVNFAKGVKEKYAGLNFGEGAFDRATEVGANLRARDLRKSLLRDARRADRMGDYQLGGAMRAKANDSQDLYAIGKTQTQAHLGLSKMPEEVGQAISDYSRRNTQDDMEKRSDDQRLSASEKAMQPKADALIDESSKDTKSKMDEFEASLGASFERGLIIKKAQIIVQGLDPDSEKKKEGSFMDGVMSYFSDMASDVSDYFTGNEGPDASSTDQAAAAGMGKASGFIPNFKSPLKDAIRRESEFVPFNSIRVDQSNKLKQSSNPFGLAVTNTIDEPRGLASIGLADGYIPNFASKKVKDARSQGIKQLMNEEAWARWQLLQKNEAAQQANQTAQPIVPTGSLTAQQANQTAQPIVPPASLAAQQANQTAKPLVESTKLPASKSPLWNRDEYLREYPRQQSRLPLFDPNNLKGNPVDTIMWSPLSGGHHRLIHSSTPSSSMEAPEMLVKMDRLGARMLSKKGVISTDFRKNWDEAVKSLDHRDYIVKVRHASDSSDKKFAGKDESRVVTGFSQRDAERNARIKIKSNRNTGETVIRDPVRKTAQPIVSPASLAAQQANQTAQPIVSPVSSAAQQANQTTKPIVSPVSSAAQQVNQTAQPIVSPASSAAQQANQTTQPIVSPASLAAQQANQTTQPLSKSQSKAIDRKFYNDKTPRQQGQGGTVTYDGKVVTASPREIQIAKIGAEKIFADTGFRSTNFQKNLDSAESWYTVRATKPDAYYEYRGKKYKDSHLYKKSIRAFNQKHAENLVAREGNMIVTPYQTYGVPADKRPVWHASDGEDSRSLSAQAPKRTPVPVAQPTLRSKIDSVNRWITGQGPLGSEAKTTTQPSARQRSQATQPSNQEAGKGSGGRDVFNPKTRRYDYFGAKKPGDKTSTVGSQAEGGEAGSRPGYKMGGWSKFFMGSDIALRGKNIYDIYNDDKLTEAEKGEKVTEESIKLVRDEAINFAVSYGQYRFQNRAGGPANAGAPAGKIPKGGPGGKIPKGGPGGKMPKGGPGGGVGGMSPVAKLGLAAAALHTLSSEYDIYKDYKKGLISKEDAQSEALKTAAWGALYAALPFIPVVGPIIGGILLAKGVWDTGYAVGGMIEEGIGLGDKLGRVIAYGQGQDENGNEKTRFLEQRLQERKNNETPEYQEGRPARLIANKQSAAALQAERADRLAGIQVAEKENEILASRVPGAFRQERDSYSAKESKWWSQLPSEEKKVHLDDSSRASSKMLEIQTKIESIKQDKFYDDKEADRRYLVKDYSKRYNDLKEKLGDWEVGEVKSVPDVNNFTYKQEKKLLDERKQRFLSVKRDVLDSPVDIPRMTDMGAPHDSYRVGANKLRHDPRLAAMYTSQSSPQSDNERLNQYLSMSESDAAYFDAKIASLEKYKTEFNRIEGNVAAYRMANAVKNQKGVNASDKEATILNMYRQLPVKDTVLKKKGMDISVRQGISPMDDNDEALLARITDFHGDRHSFSSPGGDNSLSARLNRAKTQEMEEQANKNENIYSALGMGAFGAQIDRLTPHPREEKEAKEKAERDAKLLQAMGLFYNKPLPGDPDSKTATSEEMINHAKKRGLWDNEPIVYDWQQRTMKPSGDSELALLSPEQREKAFRLMADAVKARTGFAAPLDEYQRPNAEQNALEIKDKKDLMLREYMRDPSLASVDPTLIPAIRAQQSKVLDDRQQRMTAFLEKDGGLTRATFPGKSDSQIMLNYLDMSDSQREKADALLIKQESLARLDKEAAGGALLNATTPENPALTRTFAALGKSNQVTLRSVAGNPLSAMTPQGLGLTSEGFEAAGMLNKEQESINKNQTESMTELEKLLNGYSNGFIPARSGNTTNYARGYIPNFGMGSLPRGTSGEIEGGFKTLHKVHKVAKGMEIFGEAQDWMSGDKGGLDALKGAGLGAAELAMMYIPGPAGAVAYRGESVVSQALDYKKGNISGKEFALGAGLDAANLAADVFLPPHLKLMKKTAETGYAFGNYLGENYGIHEGLSDDLAPMLSDDKESRENRERLESIVAQKEFKEERAAVKVLEEAGVLKDPYFSSGSFDRSAITAPPEKQSDPWDSSISTATKRRYAEGFRPAFVQEKRAVLSSPSYAGHRDAVPMRSNVYKNAVINSAEIEVPASEVYSRMFGPAGANMKPKNPSETHAILNPAQQQSLGFSAGFIPNFSTEQFTAAITEAMKNGIASFAGGMIPSISNSNTVNINDERSYQGNSDSMMDGVLDILQSKFPKEMGKMGPRIAKR